MRQCFSIGLFALLVLSLPGCGGFRDTKPQLPGNLDTLCMPDYASGFEMSRYDSSTLLRIVNPWQGADSVSQWVFLSRDDEKPPKGFAGETIDVPVRRIVCMSSSYVAFLEALGADSTNSGSKRFISAIMSKTTRSDAPNGSPYSENLPDDANWPARSLTASATNTTVRKHSSRASKNVPK